jgi:hypothetical protein
MLLRLSQSNLPQMYVLIRHLLMRTNGAFQILTCIKLSRQKSVVYLSMIKEAKKYTLPLFEMDSDFNASTEKAMQYLIDT